jgi:hypothetical protein
MVKKGLLVGAAGIVAIVLAVGGASEPVEASEANVAACNPHEMTTGSWPGYRRRDSLVTGPIAVPRRPLQRMSEMRNGQLYTKMGLSVSGHRFVVLSVPLALRHRVFLYYGRILDGEGDPTRSFQRARGYAETEFRPCRGAARSVWPGGIRVIGRGPVILLVTIEGRSTSAPLALGRPLVLSRG